MIRNNKGVTLVELIVTIAMLGIISVAIQGFITISAKVNANVVSDVKLQYESQLVMANVQKYIVNANKGVFVNNNTVLLASDTDREEDDINLFVFDESENILYYGEGSVKAGVLTTVSVYTLAKNVTDFDVTFESIETTDKASQANIILKMERNGEEYLGTQSIALRNNPRITNDWIVDYQTIIIPTS